MGLVDKFKGGKGLDSLAKIGTGLLAVVLGYSYAMANNVEKKESNSKNVPQVSQSSQTSQARIEDRRVEARDEIFYGTLDAYLVKVYRDTVGREKLQKGGQIRIIVPSVDFDEMPLEEVVEWFHDTTDINFHVNWNSLESQGVDRNTRVSLKLQNVQPGKVLDLVLSNAASAAGYEGIKLDYMIEGGVIEISTREQLSEKMINRVYDITDLLMPTIDKRGGSGFAPGGGQYGTGRGTGDRGRGGGGGSGGRGAGNRGSGRGGGRGTRGGTGGRGRGYGGGGGRNGGYGGRGIGTGTTGTGTYAGAGGTGYGGQYFKTKEEIANDFVEMITNIELDSWQKNGGKGTISIFNNKLIVSNNYFVHVKLNSMLGGS